MDNNMFNNNQNSNQNNANSYGQQSGGYSQQSNSYGQQSNSYSQTQSDSYGTQNSTYGTQNSTYNNQSQNYGYAPMPQIDPSVNEDPMSYGEWVGTLILQLIPCVNIILLLMWAFGSSAKESKSNYAKATLTVGAVFFVLYFILVMIIGIGSASMY